MWLLTWLIACGSAPERTPGAPAPAAGAAEVPIVVFAAASLTDVFTAAERDWAAQTGHHATFVFDASSRLEKQLEAGAAADLFVTADADWMDAAASRGLVVTESRRDLFGNTLVAIVPAAAAFVPATAAELADARIAHLALAGENVPAGRYARASLAKLGAWDGVKGKVVDGDNVRTALGWVANGEAQAGIVYGSDARAEPGVAVAFAFPDDSHTPIVYPGAVTEQSSQAAVAAAFLEFCAHDARATFEAAGFTVLQ